MGKPKQIRAVCWTWHARRDGEFPTADFVKERLGGINAWAFQMEQCPNTGKLHWQGWSRHSGAKTFDQWRGLLPGAHVEEQRARHNKLATDYCCKEETRVTAATAVALGFSPGEVGPHVKNVLLPGPKLKSELDEENMYPWQKSMMELYTGPIHPREIIWVHEKVGNTGKSALARHLAILGETLVVSGKAGDVACGVAQWKSTEKRTPPPLRLVLWDVPRVNEGAVSYQALENVKNGCFFSGKYESGMVVMEKPHVWVFANHPPDLSKLSQDRWRVYEINEDKTMAHIAPAWPVFNPRTVVEGAEEVTTARGGAMDL